MEPAADTHPELREKFWLTDITTVLPITLSLLRPMINLASEQLPTDQMFAAAKAPKKEL